MRLLKSRGTMPVAGGLPEAPRVAHGRQSIRKAIEDNIIPYRYGVRLGYRTVEKAIVNLPFSLKMAIFSTTQRHHFKPN